MFSRSFNNFNTALASAIYYSHALNRRMSVKQVYGLKPYWTVTISDHKSIPSRKHDALPMKKEHY